MSASLKIKPVDLLDREEKSLFSKASFRSALAAEFKLTAVDITLPFAGENWQVPAFQRRSLLGEKQIIIGAGFDKTGRIDGLLEENYTDFIAALSTSLAEMRIKHLSVRSTQSIPCQPDHSDKVELKINLDTACAERFKTFSQSTRRNIKRPFKNGFSFSTEKSEVQLQQFYRLYLLQIHQVGSLPLSYSFFKKVFTDNPDHFHLFIGYMDGKPAVASLNIEDGNELYGAWMGLDPTYKKHSLFLCMLWQILEHCEQADKQCFNLGRCSVGSGSHAFKQRLADESHKIYYYDIALPSFRQRSATPLYQGASWLIRHSPPVVMNRLSRTLLSHFY